MEAYGHAWTPPSDNHTGLKKFMLEQLSMSKGDTDYWETKINELESKQPKNFTRRL